MRDKNYFLSLLREAAKITKSDIGPVTIEIYLRKLEEYGWERVSIAMEKIFESLRRFPTIEEIRGAMGIEEPDSEDEANAIMGRIVKAMSRYGGYQPEEAKVFIGEIGWEAVQRATGSWSDLCMSESDQMGIIRAQLRDMVHAVKAMDSVGRLDERTALPSSSDQKTITANSEIEKFTEALIKRP